MAMSQYRRAIVREFELAALIFDLERDLRNGVGEVEEKLVIVKAEHAEVKAKLVSDAYDKNQLDHDFVNGKYAGHW